MNSQNRQKGVTMWGMLAIAVIVAFFLLIIVKVVPTYMLDMRVKSALKGLANAPGADTMTNLQILDALYKRFQIENIDERIVLRDTVSFETRGKTRIVRIAYEDVAPLLGNVSLLVEFDHSVEVGRVDD